LSDTAQIKTLGRLLLKIETRSRDGSIKKILILFLSYSLPGWFLPFLLFKQNVDPTGFEFTFLTYLFFSVILCFTILSELDNLVLSRTETEVLGTLPLNDSTAAGAKMYVLLRYLFILTIPLILPGSLFYYFIVKSVPRAFLYYASGYLLSFFITSVILLFYSYLMRNFKLRRLGTYTYLLQVFMIFFLVVGYQFISYSFTGKYNGAPVSYFEIIQKNDLIQFFPQAWFGLIPVRQNFAVDFRLLVKVILPLFISYFSYLSLRMYLAENYGKIRERLMYSKVIYSDKDLQLKISFIKRVWNAFTDRIYIRNKTEQSSFSLLKSFLRRDKAVKLNILPMIMIPAGLALFALITDQLPPPFWKAYYSAKPAFHISIILSVFVVVNTSILGIKVIGSPAAAWIYDSFPVESKKRFKNGIRKFFVLYLIIPVSVILFAIFLVKIPFEQALIHTLFIFSSANLFNTVCHSLSKTLPFTKENTLINSIQRLFAILSSILFGIPFIALQLFAYKSIAEALIASGAILTVTFWINFFVFVKE
jgi:hypothetical protein